MLVINISKDETFALGVGGGDVDIDNVCGGVRGQIGMYGRMGWGGGDF